jgi:hypothetical protein
MEPVSMTVTVTATGYTAYLFLLLKGERLLETEEGLHRRTKI